MEIIIEHTIDAGSGTFGDLLHFPDTSLQIFSIDGGRLGGRPTQKIGEVWATATLVDREDVSPGDSLTHFNIDVLSGFGAIGAVSNGAKQQLLIYEFAHELGEYLESGWVESSLDSPVRRFQLNLQNPLADSEDRLNVAADEESALLSPGAKIIFAFSQGERGGEVELGTFFVDRSEYRVTDPIVSTEGRNLIGKVLAEQTLDEKFELGYETLTQHIKDLMKHANLTGDQYQVQTSETMNWFEFKPNMTVLDAIQSVCTAEINWKIEELSDGTLAVGSADYTAFPKPGIYVFRRDRDIFSREIIRDDMSAYRRVCIHNADFSLAIYRDVTAYEGWNLQSHKTLYVEMPEGVSESHAEGYAAEIARRLKHVGKVESFVGPFRPQIEPGDSARIVRGKSEDIGVITEVLHRFGKDGFVTEFTVDSGGKLGKGRLSDYIGKITRSRESGSIGYTALPPVPPQPSP